MTLEERILFVEDDDDIRELLELYLRKSGFCVDAVSGVEPAMRSFRAQPPELLLTDILLPDGDGAELASRIRAMSDIPIIFISCKNDTQDVLDGFELGGDDYITKPFEPSLVVARVKAQLRRKRPRPLWSDRWLTIDPVACQVTVQGRPISLFAKELLLLIYLAERDNRVISVERLYDEIWGWEKESDYRTVMVHIRNLRKKIEPDPGQPRYIQTVRGFGYKFCWANAGI